MKKETKNEQSTNLERFDSDWDEGDEKFFVIFFVFPGLGGFLFGYFWLGSQVEKKYELEPNFEYLIVFLTVGFLFSWLWLEILKWFYKKVFF